jgi:hypothetical protein
MSTRRSHKRRKDKATRSSEYADAIKMKHGHSHVNGHVDCPDCGQPVPIGRPELFLIPNETIFSCDTEEALATYEDMTKLDIANHPYSHIIIGVQGNIIFGMTVATTNAEKGEYLFAFPKSEEHMSRDVKVDQETKDILSRLWGYTNEEMLSKIASRAWELRFYFYEGIHYKSLMRNSPTGQFKDMNSFTAAHKGMGGDLEKAVKSALTLRLNAAAFVLSRILVVLLATRNAVKTRTKDKLLALGIGRKSHRPLSNQKPLYTTTITLPAGEAIYKADGTPTGKTRAPHLRRGHVRQQPYGPRRAFIRTVFIQPCFVNADPSYVSTRVAYNTSL